jgi:predicted Rossmann-fold nucleotide-binding protein
MNSESFWISQDGVILAQRDKSGDVLELTISFETRNREELEFLRPRLNQLNFSERSRLARTGIELFTVGKIRIKKDKLIATAEAFVIDKSFPSHRCFRKLLKSGIAVGRLFFAPETAKLKSTEIWEAINRNLIKLPNTISIDRFGKVHFTPHRRVYTLPDELSELDLLYLVTGERPRSYLDKIQNAREVENLAIRPGAGLLTSCSMYLPHHYVVLKRANDNFGLHTGAVLLDPQKTFGSNVMLEIYNSSSEMVVNPVVSIEIFKAPPAATVEREALELRRQLIHQETAKVYERLGSAPRATGRKARPRADITLRGQSPYARNPSAVVHLETHEDKTAPIGPDICGFDTVADALSNCAPDGNTVIMSYFPNLSEHIEILTRSRRHSLRRLIFRRASRNNRFFLPNAAHAQLDAYHELGLDVYWHNEDLDELYLHTYKRNRGFFIKEELVRQFQSSTILAFYGSGVTLRPEDQKRIENLIHQMVHFFGSSMGILTGGGDGAMAVATAAGRERECLTGACFLELEAQLPNFNVDFFNSFQETSRHNRQKWFEVADFCIFNIGGVGTLEEAGIELCNLKLGIRPRVPLVFFSDGFWSDLQEQVQTMVQTKRTPPWLAEYLLFTHNPDEVISFYREKLQIL